MATTTFVLKDPKSKAPTLLFLILRHRGQKWAKVSTEEKIDPEYWDKTTCRARATRKFPEYPEFNQKLENMASRAKNVFRKFENNQNRVPSPSELKDLLEKEFNRKSHSDKSLFAFIEKFIDESTRKINPKTKRLYSNSTIEIYKDTLNLLKEYKDLKKRRLEFDSIDLDFYHDFTEYMTTEKKYSTNTIGKYIKTIKTFLSDATERGVNQNIAFKSKRFRVTTEETDAIYLEEPELLELEELDLRHDKKLEKARDLFLVACWTGLRFSDFSNIRPENIKGDMIEIEMKKGVAPVVIPIHKTVRNVMTKYAGMYPNCLPPSLSNQKMNEYIKEIGEMIPSLHSKFQTTSTKAGVQLTQSYKKFELITTHTARRSFATNLYKDGVPSYTIMKITGHKTEKSFLRYLKITSDESAKILKLHWEKKQNLKLA